MALPNQQIVDYPCFWLAIVGDFGTGKTTFLRRHLTGEFVRNHEPTYPFEYHPLGFSTNRGRIQFDCLDIGGDYWFNILKNEDLYLRDIRVDCAIIMFDVTDRLTYDDVPTWHTELCSGRENIPIVLCGNKVDVENRQVWAAEVNFRWGGNLQYYDISARTNYNFEKPFLYLLRRLAGDANLRFVEPVALAPGEVAIDLAQQQRHEAELAAAAAQPLPDEDDDAFE